MNLREEVDGLSRLVISAAMVCVVVVVVVVRRRGVEAVVKEDCGEVVF